MNYKNLVEQLQINRGERIWLSSEIIKFVLLFKKEGIKFDGSALLKEFQKAVGEEGLIMLPVFSFEFSNKGVYDAVKTKGSTGALGNIALEMNGFKRTKHPMHSFAVWGKDAEELISLQNKNSFGVDSPFGYCLKKNVRQIILGTDYVHAMTFIHYAEYVCNVPYRFAKSFTGKYITEDGREEQRTYEYAARKLEIEPTEIFNQMGSVLEEKGISRRITIRGIDCYDINLAASFPIICDDILRNQCGNIYSFNIDRKKIFND